MSNLDVSFKSDNGKVKGIKMVLDELADKYLDTNDDKDIISGKINNSVFYGKVDRENRFVSLFNPNTGFYVRSGVYNNEHIDTNIDPFLTSFPSLIDVGIMGHCIHGKSGLCAKSGVQCYQNGLSTHMSNMPLENIKKIVNECKGKVDQFAYGGKGDVDQHEDFEEIMRYTKENGIVPNFTSSGFGFTPKIAAICKENCGAVAISQYSRLNKVLLRRKKE